jgi:hypothetical protein
MKDIKSITVLRVVSEPGDMTRYDYLITNLGDEYLIMPYTSTFTFPQRILYWDIVDVNTVDEANSYVEEHNISSVNPHTMLEVIRTIKELYNK